MSNVHVGLWVDQKKRQHEIQRRQVQQKPLLITTFILYE